MSKLSTNYSYVKTIEQAKKHNETQSNKIRKSDLKIKKKQEKIERLKNQIKKTEGEIYQLEKHENLFPSYTFDENNHYGFSQVLDLSRVQKIAICNDVSGSIGFRYTIFKINGKWFKVETRQIDSEKTDSGYTNKLLELTNNELYWKYDEFSKESKN